MGVKEILGYFYILTFNYTYICVIGNNLINVAIAPFFAYGKENYARAPFPAFS